MENYFPFHKLSNLENMMANIIAEGEKKVFDSLDVIKNPLERCQQRKIYFEAMNKLTKGK